MGISGCSVAKDQANIIILNDDFASVKYAAKWGRNIFDNCRKFVQFQLTVNVSCIFIVILSGTTLGKSPFSVFQLLWINLVMDVLAAIALATEAPHPTELRKERIKQKDRIITPFMKRTILSQVAYQAFVMVILLYLGPIFFGIEYDMISEKLMDGVDPTNRLVHYTFLFHTFVLMNLFNMFNCRKLSSPADPELNVFERLHHNWWFLLILFVEFNIQFAMVGGHKVLDPIV